MARKICFATRKMPDLGFASLISGISFAEKPRLLKFASTKFLQPWSDQVKLIVSNERASKRLLALSSLALQGVPVITAIDA